MLPTENSLLDRLNESMIKISLQESSSDRINRLANSGLIEKSEMAYFKKLMANLEEEKDLSLREKVMMMNLLDKLLNLIMEDSQIYQKILHKVKSDKKVEESNNRSLFESQHTIVDKKGVKYFVNEENKLELYNYKAVKDFIEKNNYLMVE